MAVYSLIQTHNYFDLTLPRAVVDVCNLIRHGETGVFHFLESPGFESPDRELSSVFNQELRTRTRLLVKKLPDGSWNLTNIDSKTNNSDDMTKNVYIIENSKKNRVKNESLQQTHKLETSESSTAIKGENFNSQQINTESNISDDDDLGVHDHDYTGGEGDTSRAANSDDESGDENMQTITFDEDKKIIIVKSGELNDGGGVNKNMPMKSEHSLYQHPVPKPLSDIDSPSCTYCGAKTKDAFNMIKHMKKRHDQEENLLEEIEKLKPLASEKCRLCDRVFLNRKTLKEHMLNIHQEFKAIQCPHCDKKYRTPYHMKMHIKHVHLRKPKSFACEHCTRRFDTKKVLQTHILYHHSNIERIHKCELCDYKYAFPKQYYEHRTRVHGPKKEVCPFCGYKCATKWYMNKHTAICCKNKYASSEKVQKAVATAVNTHTALCPDSLAAETQLVYNPSDDTLVELDQREIAVPEVSDAMVDLPSVWDVQTPVENIAMDTVILNSDDVQEQVIVVKQEEPCQQFTIMGPDGTQHIVQLVYPDS